MRINKNKIYKNSLNWGIILLALSITFSITLMNTAAGLLFLALLIKIYSNDLKFISTGLEIPLAVFIGLFLISSFFSPDIRGSLNDILQNYWYILHLYLVVYLFEQKEMKKFLTYLGWAAFGISVYTILQSTIGLNFNLGFKIGEAIKLIPPALEEVVNIGDYSIFLGTGIMGHQVTFGGQLLMLIFVAAAIFKKLFIPGLVFLALFFNFTFSAWFGFIVALLVYVFYLKKKKVLAIFSVFVLAGLLFFAGTKLEDKEDILAEQLTADEMTVRLERGKTALRMFSLNPLTGTGSSQYKTVFDREYRDAFPRAEDAPIQRPSSIYFNILIDGGLLVFLAFLYLIIKFIRLYLKPDSSYKRRWKNLHYACWLALLAVFTGGIFRDYLTAAQNSVLIWTLAGIIIKLKKSKWSRRMSLPESNLE
ncbi:MAG: O-antigen ligase family protein [Elusimicrobiota bacterium]